MDSDEEYVPLKKRLISKGLIDLTEQETMHIDLTKLSYTNENENNKEAKHIDLTINSDDDDDDNNNDDDVAINTLRQQRSSSFGKLRRDQSNDKNWVLFRPSRRANNLTTIRDWLQSKRNARMVSEREVKTFIASCFEKFQVSESIKNIIMKHSQKHILIDQDIWNACSFVSYCHLKYLTGQTLDKHWMRTWNRISPEGKPFEDIGSMLDELSNVSGIIYIPFRTSDENENRFNTMLPYTTNNGLIFNTPYERIKYCFESLLDRNIPIAFNQAQHSRVAVSYNEEDILCIDSFPRLYEETHEYMYFLGGLSIVKKDYVYEWVRDAIIIDKNRI